MGDAVLADPQGQNWLPLNGVRLNEAFNTALEIETAPLWPEPRWPEGVESAVAPRPVEYYSRQNVLPMSMDDVLKLADARIARRQVGEFNDAPSFNSSMTSEWPERHKRRYEEVESGVAPRRVKFRRHEQRNEGSGSGNAFLAGWQGQTPLAMDVWHNGAHNITPHHEIPPGQCISQDEQELARRAAVAEPGSQTPGVAVDGVALRHPHLKLPSDNHGATASGSRLKKILNEVSAGTNLMAACKAAYCICYGV